MGIFIDIILVLIILNCFNMSSAFRFLNRSNGMAANLLRLSTSKHLPSGAFDGLKARLVANRAFNIESMFNPSDSSSPTVAVQKYSESIRADADADADADAVIYLSVPYSEKDAVKSIGAKWNAVSTLIAFNIWLLMFHNACPNYPSLTSRDIDFGISSKIYIADLKVN